METQTQAHTGRGTGTDTVTDTVTDAVTVTDVITVTDTGGRSLQVVHTTAAESAVSDGVLVTY